MKKLLVGALAVSWVVAALPAHSAIIDCSQLPGAGGALDTGNLAWSNVSPYLAGQGNGCYQQDKEFSNFSILGAVPTDLALQIKTVTQSGQDYHTVSWTGLGDFYDPQRTEPLAFTYTVKVKSPPALPTMAITGVQLDADVNPGDEGPVNASLSEASAKFSTLFYPTGSQKPVTGSVSPGQTTLTVTHALVPTPDGLLNSSAAVFIQSDTAIPEIDVVAGTGALTLLAGALALAGERRRRQS